MQQLYTGILYQGKLYLGRKEINNIQFAFNEVSLLLMAYSAHNVMEQLKQTFNSKR